MKTLTIRLDEADIARIEAMQERTCYNGRGTINGTIKYALKLVEEYTDLHSKLIGLFSHKWEVDQKKLRELNDKYGFLQRNLF